MLKFCSLYSGSTGNSLFVESDNVKLLVDSGVSAKKVEDGLNSIGVNINDIDAILVTHEHSDHIQSLGTISKKFDIPVICYGLRADFRLEFFEGSLYLMAIADKIEEIKTVCECGAKATCNMRMINGKATNKGEKILIGGNDSYKSVCRKCYKKYIKYGME